MVCFLVLALFLLSSCPCKSSTTYPMEDEALFTNKTNGSAICPLGLISEGGNCRCPDGDFGGTMMCEQQGVNHIIHLKRSYWLGYVDGKLVTGLCKFCSSFYAETTGEYIQLNSSNNNTQCSGNRNETSELCSKCSKNYFIAISSEAYACTKDCRLGGGIALLLFIQILCVTVLFLSLFLTNFGLVTGPLNAVIFFAQMYDKAFDLDGLGLIPLPNITDHYDGIHKAHQIIYGVWNLHFFRPMFKDLCFPGITKSMTTVLAMDYLISLYLLALIGIVFLIRWLFNNGYIRCSPYFNYRIQLNIDYKEAIRNTLASFLLLSYTLFGVVSFYLLMHTCLVDKDGNCITNRAYFDGSMKVLDKRNVVNIILSSIGVIFLILLPLVLIFLRHNEMTQSPTFLDAILEPFHRDFRSDCDCKYCKTWKFKKLTFSMGVHDYCWVAGGYFILRLVFLLIFIISPGSIEVFLTEACLCTLVSIFFYTVRPYKKLLYNNLDGTIFILLALISLLNMYQYHLTMNNHALSKPVLYIELLITYIPLLWIVLYIIKRSYRKCLYCFSSTPLNKPLEGVLDTNETTTRSCITKSLPEYGTFSKHIQIL